VLVQWVVDSCVSDLGWVFRLRWAWLDCPFMLYFAGVRERTDQNRASSWSLEGSISSRVKTKYGRHSNHKASPPIGLLTSSTK